jgi:hypothetical protein
MAQRTCAGDNYAGRGPGQPSLVLDLDNMLAEEENNKARWSACFHRASWSVWASRGRGQRDTIATPGRAWAFAGYPALPAYIHSITGSRPLPAIALSFGDTCKCYSIC